MCAVSLLHKNQNVIVQTKTNKKKKQAKRSGKLHVMQVKLK